MSSACPFHSSERGAPFAVPTGNAEAELAFLIEANEREGLTNAAERMALCRQAMAAGRPAPLTAAELSWAGRFAWRNHSRCIGRLYWESLRVRDCRDVADAPGMFDALVEHLGLATNEGNVRSVMTVFAPAEQHRPGPRIWNHQLCGYAGYRAADGAVLGDPLNVKLTDAALALGWNPGTRTAFDLLPWIIQGVGEKPQVFPLPPGLVKEVPLHHPTLPWFETLGLRWYAVPVISDMRFRAAGTDFGAAPFNGWYMGTEIGARNLADQDRYNLLPMIADRLGLDRSEARSLWIDRALVELNVAVLHSFAAAGVKMVDHHTASGEFLKFCGRERSAGRAVSARWDWIVPPMSPAATGGFHQPMTEFATTPDFHRQDAAC